MPVLFRRVEQEGPLVKQFQQNVEQAIQELNQEIFISGKLFTVTRTNTAIFEIQTGFTQSVRGFVVADTNVASTFFRTETARDKTICSITPSAAGTYKFWVF